MNIRSLFNRAFPHTCLLCSAPSGTQRLCRGCHADLPRHLMPQCPQCAIPTPDGQTCGACLKHPPAYDHTRAAFTYTFPIDRLIPALKYSGKLVVAPVLGEYLAKTAENCPRPGVLIPMPLHPARIRQRGFNHATEIAREIEKILEIPLDTSVCQRIRDTPPQVALAYDQRRRNVRDAFVCRGGVTGKRVAIIDDVFTTGASLNEMARILKKAGAAEVHPWVVARTLPPC